MGQQDDSSGRATWTNGDRESDESGGAHGNAVRFLRESLSGAAVVVVVGLLLFAISGIWPPLVAVESGSMSPHLQKGDLVFVMDAGRLSPDAAREPGVVSTAVARTSGIRTFHGYGTVIVYRPDGHGGVPIIHRARFWVEKGENWYDRADARYLRADSCADLPSCPAPHAGFITKGDHNPAYDQGRHMGLDPVKPDWVVGKAVFRIPYLGWIRLALSGQV